MMVRIFILLLCGFQSIAQVANNNIEQRLRLDLSKPVHSSTAAASVQWKCINKALTNKCLVYHNDQWFSFTVAESGNYFINISAQSCRDSRGVQIILIEGNPCEIQTYKILECISLIRKEDVFVEMNSLKPNTQYLINVDGFLGDFCEFNIELSDRPKGLPRNDVVNLDTLKVSSRIEQKIVTMEWSVEGSLAQDLSTFKVFRQAGKGSANVVSEISLGRNAYGITVRDYQFTDTLKAAGVYKYDIYGIRESDAMPLLLSEKKFTVDQEDREEKEVVSKVLPVRLMFKEHDQFHLRLYNYDGDHLLWKHSGESQGEGELFMIDPQPYLEYGLRKFQLLILDRDGNKVAEVYFRVDNNGGVIKE